MAGQKQPGPRSSSLLDQHHQRVGEQNRQDISNSKIVDGKLTDEYTTAASTQQTVVHKLGRKPAGWIVVSLSASAAVITPLRQYQASDKEHVYLSNDATVEVKYRLWVF